MARVSGAETRSENDRTCLIDKDGDSGEHEKAKAVPGESRRFLVQCVIERDDDEGRLIKGKMNRPSVQYRKETEGSRSLAYRPIHRNWLDE